MIFNMTSGKMKTPVLNGSYPANVTVNAGTSAAFQVEISEDGLPKEYTYQWYVNGTAVSGATSASYTRSTTSDMGTYSVYCVVTNKAGSVTSRTATLTVRKTPVLSSSYPANATVVKNTAVTSKVSISTAGYPASYTYQWYKNGTAVSGATSSTYTFTPTAAGATTLYCKVTNAAGTVTSRTATITATDLYLYNEGDQCTANSGGWTFVNGSNVTCTFESDSMHFKLGYGDDNCAAVYTKNKIDLTNFSKLNADIKGVTSQEAYSIYSGISVNTANTSDSPINHNKVANIHTPSSTRQTLALDISSLSGSYYIAAYSYQASEVYVYKIWLS